MSKSGKIQVGLKEQNMAAVVALMARVIWFLQVLCVRDFAALATKATPTAAKPAHQVF